MENSHIEWTNHTFNPWWGCMKVSEGCKNCYAMTLDNRYHHADPHWGPNSSRKPMSEAYWKQPIKWNTDAQKAGINAKVFCASMADVFEDHPDTYGWRMKLLELISKTPNLTWQILTKRPENIMKLAYQWILEGIPNNVWIGTSVENQAAAYERIPHLLKVPAKVRFLSCEPLLGPIDFGIFLGKNFCGKCHKWNKVWTNDGFNACCSHCLSDNRYPNFNYRGIHWVIGGGESGHNARPMHPDWARSLRDQCKSAGISFFFKQWGEYWPAGKSIVENKEMVLFGGEALYRVGKKDAGSFLDGKEYKEFPDQHYIIQ